MDICLIWELDISVGVLGKSAFNNLLFVLELRFQEIPAILCLPLLPQPRPEWVQQQTEF